MILSPNMTPNELLNASHSFTGKPAILFISLFASIIYFFSIYFVMDKDKVNWGKLGLSYFLFLVLLTLAILFSFNSPNSIQALFSWISGY